MSYRFHNSKFVMAIVLFLSINAQAQAVVLPWLPHVLQDPFGTEKKVNGLIPSDLKPSNCPGSPNLEHPLHFEEIVVASLCNNPNNKAAYLSLLSQAASYGTNYAAYLPNISASGGRARTTSFFDPGVNEAIGKSYSLTGGVTLYDFGQREFALAAAEKSLIIAGYSYDSTLQGAIAAALQGYYQLLTSQNAVKIAKESLEYAKQSYDAASLRHKIGQVPLADELSAQVSYSSAVLASQQADVQLSQNRASLALLIGLRADAPLQVSELDNQALAKDPFTGDVMGLMEQAKRKRVDFLSSQEGLEAAKISQEEQKRADLGSISATTNIGYSGTDIHLLSRSPNNSRSQSIGLSVSIPIFTGFSQVYSERATEKAIEAQEQGLIQTERSVEQDVWNSWHNYQIAKQSWQVSEQQLSNSTLLKDVTLGRYKEGLGTILDVLSAQSQYNNALQSQLQARYNLLTTRVDLVRSAGVLDLNTMRPETLTTIPPPSTSQ